MKEIPTAEEFWSEIISSENEFSMLTTLKKSGMHKHVFEAMRRFAKLHVEAALKEASEKAEAKVGAGERSFLYVDENSILNAYPLNLIK